MTGPRGWCSRNLPASSRRSARIVSNHGRCSTKMTSAIRGLLTVLIFLASNAHAAPVPDLPGEWARLTHEAVEMGLPSRFLRLVPLEFVKLEFADLRNVAAE